MLRGEVPARTAEVARVRLMGNDFGSHCVAVSPLTFRQREDEVRVPPTHKPNTNEQQRGSED